MDTENGGVVDLDDGADGGKETDTQETADANLLVEAHLELVDVESRNDGKDKISDSTSHYNRVSFPSLSTHSHKSLK